MRFIPAVSLVRLRLPLPLSLLSGEGGSAPSRERRRGPMVKRLRHRPFTAVTRVRFPFGSPRSLLRYGRIAQLVRALASHARGQRFESVCAHQKRKRFTFIVDRFLFWWELPVPARSPPIFDSRKGRFVSIIHDYLQKDRLSLFKRQRSPYELVVDTVLSC